MFDPLIKGLIETSFNDWEGKVACVLFLPGCNFRCLYCHSHELIAAHEQLPSFPFSTLRQVIGKYDGWVDGVVISGGEPTIFPELPQFIKTIRSLGLPVKLDTNGFNPRMLSSLIKEGLINYVAMDIKAPLGLDGNGSPYSFISGTKVDEDALRESIRTITQSGIDHEFRTTLVPPYIDEESISLMASSIRGARRYILQPFDPRYVQSESLQQQKPWPNERVKAMLYRARAFVPFTRYRGQKTLARWP